MPRTPVEQFATEQHAHPLPGDCHDATDARCCLGN
jgi:hypothetical protein